MTKFDEVVLDLNKRPIKPKNHKWDLKSMHEALAEIGNPEKKYKSVQIVGTNGKGSTAFFISKIIEAHGFKVGLYTSPHLMDVRERIQINGKLISQNDFAENYNDLLKILEKLELAYFERMTLIASKYFADQQCDFVVFETGLGGRLDAVTSLACKNIVFTSISLDHTEMLGSTLEKIAEEKAYPIKNAELIMTVEQKKIVQDYLIQFAVEQDKQIEIISTPESNMTKDGMNFDEFTIPMFGDHYAKNANIAIYFAREFLKEKFSIENTKSILKNSHWKGRMEIRFWENTSMLLSCAHNEDSIIADAFTIEQMTNVGAWDTEFDVLCGLTGGRSGLAFLQNINKNFGSKIQNVYIVPLTSHFETYEKFKKEGKNFSEYKLNFCDNLPQAFELIKKEKRPVLVIGSIYLVGEVLLFV